jgi:DNA-binding FadR family transcriptional regulator
MKQKQSPVKRAGIISKSQVKTPAASGGMLIRVPKMAEVVADHIRNMIVRGDLKEGDFLVPEAQLMQQFGTSRPTIREAFRILEGEQFITVTRGSRTGAKVTHPAVDSVARMAGFVLQCQGTSVRDIYEARLAIEPRAAFLAAKQADRAGADGLTAELEALRDTFDRGDISSFRKAVARFHQSVVALSGNRTLMLVFAMLVGVLENHQARFSPPPEARVDESGQRKATQAALRSMERLIAHIASGDAETAEAHWRRHIENANKAWLAGHDQTVIVDVLSWS